MAREYGLDPIRGVVDAVAQQQMALHDKSRAGNPGQVRLYGLTPGKPGSTTSVPVRLLPMMLQMLKDFQTVEPDMKLYGTTPDNFGN